MQRLQSKQDESAEGEEMKQQQKLNIMKDLTKKTISKRRIDAESQWWVTELLPADSESVDPSRMGTHHAEVVGVVGENEKGR